MSTTKTKTKTSKKYDPKYVFIDQVEEFASKDDLNNWLVQYKADYTEVKRIYRDKESINAQYHYFIHVIRKFATTG